VVNSQPALSQVLVQDVAGQKTFYVYGLGLIGQEVDDEYTSYHFDFRGSTVALSDENSQVVEQYQYSPYGLLLSGDSSKTPFLFNGMYGVMTDSNGMYYMRARFYSPEIKRFVNQDILLGDIFEGQTLNRYVYVNGDPVKYNDPFGLARCGPGYKAVSDPTQPHVSYCVKDGSDPFEKICVTPECLLRDAANCGNDNGPRPYGGFGWYIDEHFLLLGITVEESIITEGEKSCRFKSECVSIGPGMFLGAGGALPGGVAADDIEDSLAGNSVGISFDGGCLKVEGWNLAFGYNEDGITSVGSAKGFARSGGGCGIALTLDLCKTKVKWCNTP
jgi:RHS repeat-associated protein